MTRLEQVLQRAREADRASEIDESLASCIFTGTGFSGDSRVHLRALCSLRGITYSGDLCRNSTTHLVVNNRENNHVQPSEKLAKAAQWGISIVSLDWFLDSVEAGFTRDTYENTPVSSAAKRQPSPADCSADNRPALPSPSQSDREPLNAVENTLASYMQQLEIAPEVPSQYSPSDSREPWPSQFGGSPLQSPDIQEALPLPSLTSPMVTVQERDTSPSPQLNEEEYLELSLGQCIISPSVTIEEHNQEIASDTNVDDDFAAAASGELETNTWAEPQPAQPQFPTPDWGSEEDSDDEPNELNLRRGLLESSSPAADLEVNSLSRSDYQPAKFEQPAPCVEVNSLSPSDYQLAGFEQEQEGCFLAPTPTPAQREGSATPLDQHRLRDFVAVETESQVYHCEEGNVPEQQQNEETPLSFEPSGVAESVISEGSSQDSDFREHKGGPAVVVRAPRLPLPIPCAAEDDAIPIKLLLRAPRGSTVKARHNLRDLKGAKATFAEEIYLPRRELRLSVKDKSMALVLQNGAGLLGAVGEGKGPILVQPLSFYRLLGEDWYMEASRLYTSSQALALAEASGAALHLPLGFDSECELLRSTEREHVELSRVEATVTAWQVKPGTAVLRVKNNSSVPAYFWRREMDPCVPCIVMPPEKK